MAAKRNQLEEPEELEELKELDTDLDEDDDEDPDVAVLAETEEEPEDSSLEELLARRAAARRGTDESDDEDIMSSLAPEREVPAAGPLPTRVVPVKDRQEFVCKRCHLVKARSQLADPKRGLCRDCV